MDAALALKCIFRSCVSKRKMSAGSVYFKNVTINCTKGTKFVKLYFTIASVSCYFQTQTYDIRIFVLLFPT